jgi:hypothetical protein
MSDIIYTPPASGGGGTTINPTNNVLPVRSNATTFVDSFIRQVGNEIFTANSFGWTISYDDLITLLGDFNYINNGTNIFIDDNNQLIYTLNNGQEKGLRLNFANNLYQFGDYQGVSSGNSFWIDDANNLMRTYNGGQRNGFEFVFNAKTYSFGDFDTINSGTAIFIEDNNENITFRVNNQITFQGNNLQDNNPRTYSGRNIVVRAPNGGTYYLPLYS